LREIQCFLRDGHGPSIHYLQSFISQLHTRNVTYEYIFSVYRAGLSLKFYFVGLKTQIVRCSQTDNFVLFIHKTQLIALMYTTLQSVVIATCFGI